MKRESVNPWDRGIKFNMDQGELVQGLTRTLYCSGQVSVDPDSSELGIAVIAPGDLRGQMGKSLANIDESSPKLKCLGRTSCISSFYYRRGRFPGELRRVR